ncbi:hypothetical protein L1887_20641 [Cichorium endivia]|nr:hypothetical protein L1887_20641 [Cichorium endivia]
MLILIRTSFGGIRETGRRRKEELQGRFSEPLNLLFCSSFSCSPISHRFTQTQQSDSDPSRYQFGMSES